MQKWNAITIKNLHSTWSAELITIYVADAMSLSYNILLSDTQDHHQKIFAPENRMGTVCDTGAIYQSSTTHIYFLLARTKELTRIKLQFFDDHEFLLWEFAVPKALAIEESSTMTDDGVIRFPSKYEACGVISCAAPDPKATNWGLFLPDGMD